MSTAAHPETDGQTERVNRVLEDILRSYATSFAQWSDFLPMVEFSINNSTHASTGYSPFYINYGFHPRVPTTLLGAVSTLSGGGTPNELELKTTTAVVPSNSDILTPASHISRRDREKIEKFIDHRQVVVRFVCDAIAQAQDRQKEQADKHGRKNTYKFRVGDLVLLSTANLPEYVVSNLGSNKLLPRFIGPFKVTACKGDAYTIDIPTSMKLHPTFYVGRLKPYLPSVSAKPTEPDKGEQLDPEVTQPFCEDRQVRNFAASSRHGAAGQHQNTGPSQSQVQEVVHRNREAEYQNHDAETQNPLGGHPLSTQLPRQHHGGDVPRIPEPPPAAAILGRPVECLQNSRAKSRTHWHEPRGLRSESTDPSSVDATPRSASHGRSSTSRAARSSFRSAPPPVIDSHGERRWLVESIVDHKDHPTLSTRPRKKQHDRFYRVRWRGYQQSDDTWEPRQALMMDVPDIVRDYENAL